MHRLLFETFDKDENIDDTLAKITKAFAFDTAVNKSMEFACRAWRLTSKFLIPSVGDFVVEKP